VTTVDCACWGESGNAANGVNGSHSGGGAGAGECAEETALAVTPGSLYTPTIGTGGTNTATTFPGDSVTVTAHAGASATTVNGAIGGTGSSNSIHNDGGHGGNGSSGTNKGGGGGGGSGGSGSAGGNGGTGTTVGGTAGSAGTGTNPGAAGSAGGGPTTAGGNGNVPGGAPGGGGNNGNRAGGNAVAGQIQLTYSAPASGTAALSGAGTLTAAGSIAGASTLTGVGTLTAAVAGAGNATLTGTGTLTAHATQAATATLSGVGTLTASGGLPAPVAVNQWAATFAQPSAFGTTPPELQSLVVPLTPAYSVGGGSGTPSSGNWLFCLSGWNQDGLPAVTTGDADDIHSFWRPGDVTTSTWAVSPSSAATRCNIWYTPNLARVAGDVYSAPSGAMAGQAVLVVEITGLGPWDTVTGISSAYSAAATSLGLTLAAPSAAAFTIACVAGDSTAAGQAFAPSGWTTLATVSASDGTDHSCDAVLTSAFKPSTSGSISVSGTASSASDLSGVILQVAVAAASPLTATGVSGAWPGRVIYEFAPGAGFGTPPDELTWVTLSDSAAARGTTKRAWAWNDKSGVPYSLGQLQSGSGNCQLDNADGYLTPSNSATSPWYPDVVTGTPVRVRVALGTMGGTTWNRWYTIQRNMLSFDEKRDPAMRNYIDAGLTDIWSVVAGTCPSPYRGEVQQDSPGWWWPFDDQPLAGGVQPTSLANAAAGSLTPMTVYAAAGGVTAGDAYTTTGIDATAANTPPDVPPSVATYSVAQQQGWMYGDPQSSPGSYATGNPVTANPGSAAWQQTGMQGAGGTNGWFMAATDTYPALSGGMSFGVWFNAAFFASATGWKDIHLNQYFSICGQPYSPLTLATLATASAPVAVLQLDISGHLNLVTYAGSTPTTHAIYTASDLRSASWHHVMLTTDGSSWNVYVNGGLTASVSGSGAGMTSSWSWLVIGADLGAAGGSSLSSAQHMGNVAYSHAEIYPAILPAWRILARYCAAATGFGLLPAPQTVSLSTVANQFGTGFVPDGSLHDGSYGSTGSAVTTYTFSGLAVAQAGSYTSGPSARAVTAGLGQDNGGIFFGNAVWVSFTSLSPSAVIYTAASASGETGAATVCGSGDSFSAGFGSGASGAGVCQTAAGSGASPPAGPSALGDTVGQRIERILGYGQNTYPGRAIDPAPLAVQAALDVGGQQTGGSIQNIVGSDNGLLTVDNCGNLCYRMKSHLAADTVVWQVSSAGPSYGLPFRPDQAFGNDPQRVWNFITITPYSPDGASLPVITPASASAADTSQEQYGVQPKAVTSYLQSTAEMQAQANWLLTQFGSLKRRVTKLTIDAAAYPAAWGMVLGCNPGDLVSVVDLPMQGGPQTTGTYRISSISRTIAFGANGNQPEASVTIIADAEPSSWWT